MRNKYLESLNKIEFVLTYACTGRCEHCSEGDHDPCGQSIDGDIAADAVRKISAEYDIKTVMTFGGEPLLCADAVYAVMNAASECGISKRQLITNGFFSSDEKTIVETVKMLSECGVNDILLSVDAFHQRTIPLETVRIFAESVKDRGLPIRFSPAWLVSREHDNPYNRKTAEILRSLGTMNIPTGNGNIVFPQGNARKYLSEYFRGEIPLNPYRENPRDVRCVSVSPNGDMLYGNIYRQDVMDIIREYIPKEINE